MKTPPSCPSLLRSGLRPGFVALLACVGTSGLTTTAASAAAIPHGVRPNVLIIIADDLSYGSLGFAGGVAPEVSPNLDRLAGDGFRFTRAHVTASVCQPSRQSMFSGLYPHRYGSFDFWPMRAGTPTLSKRLRESGYVTAAFAKLQHMKSKEDFAFEIVDEDLNLGVPLPVLGRNPALLAKGVAATIEAARRRSAPFLAVVNSEDPHRPFHGDPFEADVFEDDVKLIPPPSRVYGPAEVTLPPTLPDLPGIRTDLARYASSIRRLDDTVGSCLRTLRDHGVEQDTMVIFVSDNGMPLPFAKFDAYVESTRTPLIIRWPRHLRGGRADDRHLVSLADIAPTLVELAGARPLGDIDGRSLLPLLFGDGSAVPWRTHLITVRYEEIYYGDGLAKRERRTPGFIAGLSAEGWVPRPEHEAAGTHSRPNHKRAVVDDRYVYIYNHFYDGTPRQAFPYGDASYQAMLRAARDDAALRERVEFYRFRAQEELYDYVQDAGYHHNLSSQPGRAAQLREARARLQQWMRETSDPIRADFELLLRPVAAR